MNLQKMKTAAALALSCVLAACGSGGTPEGLSIAANGDMTVAQASAQKGPFIAGSTVTLNVMSRSTTIRELNPQSTTTGNETRLYNLPVLSQTGKTFTLETDNKGVFLTNTLAFLPGESVLQVSVEGYYFDEITGLRSSDQIALRGIIDISSTAVNVNILTDLSRARVLKLAREICPIPTAPASATAQPCLDKSKLSLVIEQAEREVLQAFNVPVALLGTPQKRFADMNFKNIADTSLVTAPRPEDQFLLAISALVMQIGQEGSGVTEFTNAFEADLEADGVLNTSELKERIARASATVNFSQVARNMNAFYKTNKYASVDLQKWVDPSGGVVGVIAGQSDFYNLTPTTFNESYTSAEQTFKASGKNGSCLQLVSSNASSSLKVVGTTTTTTPNTSARSAAVYVPKDATVKLSITSTPTSLSGQARVIASDAPAAPNSCPANVETIPAFVGVYYFAATPPGLNNFANKFIADFAKCFNLTVTNRVRATDLSNPDIPEVTEINDVCKPLAGSPSRSYLHNGYNAGQLWYWMLSDGAMTKTARITEMDVTDYFVSTEGQPVALVRFSYVDRFKRKWSTLVVARQEGSMTSDTSGWYNTGNRQPVDINLMVGVRKYTSLPIKLTTDRPLTQVKIKYNSAFLPIIRAVGPGMTLQNGTKLTAVKVTGPGLPAAGLVYVPPLQKGQTDFDFSNMEGTLPDGRPQHQLKRCGWQPVATNGVWPAVPASCPLNWIATSGWTAPSTSPTAATKMSDLVYPAPAPGFGNTFSSGIALPTNGASLMTKGTEYLFSLYYGNSTTPQYEYYKRLLTSVPTFAEAHASKWVNLENVGTVNIRNLTGTNAFESLRPVANQTTLDISWRDQVMNSVEVASINTNLQRAHYPRATPGDSVARGLNYGTLAPQLDQDGVSLEMQWTGATNTDGTPKLTESPLNLSRNISLSLRTWDYSWKSQDYIIQTYNP